MTRERNVTLWLLAMCAIWGSSFFTMKLGTEGVASAVGEAAAPSAFLFLRFLVAAALHPLIFRGVLGKITGRVAWHGFLLALPFYAGFILQVTGLTETTSTVSAFLTNLTVILTPILGRLFFRERLTGAVLGGGIVTLAGVYVLTNPAGGDFKVGEAVTIACAVAFALQIQLTNVITKKSDPDAVTFVMFGCAVVFSGLTLAVMGVGPADLARGLAGPDVAWTVIYTGVACSVVAITIMNRFQREVEPTRAAVLYTIEPVFAAAMAAAFVGELLTWRMIAGGAVILGGNVVCELLRGRGAAASGRRSPEP